MILKENEFYYNKDINELFIISKDESDINDKINKFYYKKLIERNLDYHDLNDTFYHNGNVVFDLMDNDKIFFSDIYDGTRKYIPVGYVEFLYSEIENDESTLQLDIFISKDNDVHFLEIDDHSQGVSITMMKDFCEKDLINYNKYENDLNALPNLFDIMLKENNNGNIKIFINGIDIFEPHAYFRKLEDEKEIKNTLVNKNFI
ncbi:hypothetical protein CPT_MarsHill_122 [Staphylococcus phage MarsHill]|nr:hypothetical protein CPT_MarsHill_122 [Staphylococcus phage MarsHill]